MQGQCSTNGRARSGRRRGSIAAHVHSAAFGVLSDIGTPSSLDVQQIADQRRTISAFGVGLAPGQQSRPPRNRPSPGISSQSQVRFRSGHCGDRNGMVPALLPGSLLFIFAS
jgi:hypothetical protein